MCDYLILLFMQTKIRVTIVRKFTYNFINLSSQLFTTYRIITP
jgi:hypothetical protein